MNITALSTVSGKSATLTASHPTLQPQLQQSASLKPVNARTKKRNLVPRRMGILCGLLALTALVAGSAAKANSIYVSSNMTLNSNGTMEGTNYNSTGSRGIFFTTGPSGPFTIDLFNTVFRTSAGAIGDTYTFNIDVRNVSGGLPGTTLLATDAVSWQSTSSTGVDQNVSLTGTNLPNISSFAFQSNTSYSFVLYGMKLSGSPSANVGMMRNSSLGAASTVSYTNGFSNAGFFQNNFTYAGSHSISLGTTAVPEPSTWGLIGLGSLVLAALGGRNLRRHRA